MADDVTGENIVHVWAVLIDRTIHFVGVNGRVITLNVLIALRLKEETERAV